jgi:predicted outer membrane lipoprotein
MLPFALPAILGSPIARALGLVVLVAMAYVFVDARARTQERAACNERARQSQEAAREIDKTAADKAAQRAIEAERQLADLDRKHKELIDEFERALETPLPKPKPGTVISCPPGRRLFTDDDLRRLRGISKD